MCTGRVTRHIRQTSPNSAKLVATDLNPGMLEVAKGAIKEMYVEFCIANAQALPFGDESFD